MNNKKSFNLKTVFAIAFIVLTLGVFFVLCVNGVSTVINEPKDAATNKVHWDEKKEYPSANIQVEKVENDTNQGGVVNKTLNELKKVKRFGTKNIGALKNLITNITKDSSVYMPGVKVKKAWDKYVYGFDGNTSTNGTEDTPAYSKDIFIYLGEGCWSYVEDAGVPVEQKAQLMVDFANQQKSLGRNFIFLEATEKRVNIPKKYEGVFGDNFYKKYNASMKYLKDNGVDYLSTTEIINNSGIDRKDLFFKTDHHWLPQTGLWMTKELAEKLNNEYGYNVDISKLEIENFDVTYFESPFLGSIGGKVTEVYSECEYLPVLTPKYDTNLTVTIPELGYEKTGKFQDTIYDYAAISDDPYNCQYFFYAYGERKLVTIKNNNLHNGKRILVIKKSMANVITPFMSNIAEYVDVIDLRHFKGSIQSFIEQTNPDTISVIYSAAGFANDDDNTKTAFNFMN